MAAGSVSGHFTPICVDPVAFPPYLQGMSNLQGTSQGLSDAVPAAEPHGASNRALWPLIAAAIVFGGLVAVAGALWLHYGTAVFFEIVRAGIAACF